MIAHLLSTLRYSDIQRPPLTLPPRPAPRGYQRPPRDEFEYVPNHAAELERAIASRKKTKD